MLELTCGHRLVDLGCGAGGTLHHAVGAEPTISLIGIDTNERVLEEARALLGSASPELYCADLASGIGLADQSVDRLVCHNVLECLRAPAALVEEAHRVLAPGGRAVWSHVDFGAIVCTSTDVALGRTVVGAYADLAQQWMAHVDGQMGRKLPGVVRNSSLDIESVIVYPTVATELAGDALTRVDEIAEVLCASDQVVVSNAEVRAWRDDLDRLDAAGRFFFMEPTVIVSSTRRERL